MLEEIDVGERVRLQIHEAEGTLLLGSTNALLANKSVGYFVGSEEMEHALSRNGEYKGPICVSFHVAV
jgi:hypothetical protein